MEILEKVAYGVVVACLLVALAGCEDRDNRPTAYEVVDEVRGPKNYNTSAIEQDNGTCVIVSYYYWEVTQTLHNPDNGEVHQETFEERGEVSHSEQAC